MKITKKLLAILMAACLVLTATACGGSKEPAASDTPAKPEVSAPAEEATAKAYHIGFALDTYANPICAQICKIAEDECKARGYEITITDGEGDVSKQLADISSLIQKKVDAIIVLPVNSNAIDEGIEAAYDAGIPIATVLRNTPNVADKLVCFSGTDDVELGSIGGQWIADVTGGKGKIVYITGRTGVSTAENRTVGFHQVVDQYPDLEIVAEQDGNYSRADAMTQMEAILQANSEIDAVWCANDEMAGGVCQAISAAGREGILVGGANFQSDGYARLMSGEQAADITTPCAMVIPALDALITVLDGGTHTEKVLYYPLDLITAENADDFKDQLY